ncbi:glycosyltransferase family 2 protein [uncultured Pseudokineococcus sp.]|uniref:glycosyltransferase family 2 protein n=1 Tax=uncultured Pseudokineococcus sp. TaxID=1642928 RepID=UPI00263602A2|nr:glycosyltransferase family 2 protein [uncultured Pseudokineococcus sp.]
MTPPEGRRSTVSVVIPCRDELTALPRLVEALRRQSLQPDEVVVADGMSTDGTRQVLADLAASDPRVVVVDNPDRTVPAAMNVLLARATGDYVARMDTHAEYAPDYLEAVVGVLDRDPGAVAVGSAMATAGRGRWGRAIAAVLGRRIGLGGASHRVGGAAGPVPHVFSGCYRRSAVLEAGGWDERLRANEDFEADQRVGRLGRILLEPSATSTWYVREAPRALAVQMWRYGFYKALTLRLHPDSLKVRQLAPPAVVAGLLATTAVRPRAGLGLLAAYLAVAGAAGARAASADGADAWRGAVVPPVVHLSWGAGLLAGTVRFAGVRRRGGAAEDGS